MTWRLKDQKLQKQLDEISDGDFSKALANNRLKLVNSLLDPLVKWSVFFGDTPDCFANRFSVCFREDEVEEIPEYKAGGWNHWPETKPEECVLMEIRKDGKDETHGFLFFLGNTWYHAMGLTCLALSDEKFRYRPAKLFFEEQRINERE